MESAISQIDIGDVPVITRYRPWLLRPNLAREPTKYVDKRESYIKMFKGDVGRFNAMVKRITDIGLEDDVNIAFKYEGDIGTTINCSQLIMWAETYGLQQHYDLKEAIMSAYHEQAKNIALPEVMLDCVRQVDGLKEHVEEAEMVLQTDAFKKAVEISRGDLVFLLDSDDYFNEEKVKKIVDYFEKNKKAEIVFDYPFIVKNKNIYPDKNNSKILKTYWSYIHPTSCISVKKNCFLELLDLISYEDYTDVWIDLRISLFSKYILKDFHILNENLTFYRKTEFNVSSKFRKFSKNWWKRRRQAHEFFQKFAQDNGLNFNKNLDFFITKIICGFLK
mgnify:CR=1 FL=1